MPEQSMPGTVIEYKENSSVFSRYRPLIQATDGLTLSQVCAITGLEASTIQNWVKRRFVARPVNKKYHERHLARILLISALRECMKLENIGELLQMINGSADDESDDIISEESLYDYFSEIITKSKHRIPGEGEIPQLVDDVMRAYKAPQVQDEKRLKEALNVMVLAYSAAEYKKMADTKYEKLKRGDYV